MIRVKVVGATGYGGVGITELVLQHPEAKLVSLVAREDVGQSIAAVYPHLQGFCDLPVLAADDPRAAEPADVVFFATPDKVGMTAARAELAKGAKVIDYSGDFRFTTVEAYADYATRIGKEPTHAYCKQCAAARQGPDTRLPDPRRQRQRETRNTRLLSTQDAYEDVRDHADRLHRLRTARTGA